MYRGIKILGMVKVGGMTQKKMKNTDLELCNIYFPLILIISYTAFISDAKCPVFKCC